MNTPTLTGAYTCTHHTDAERTACPVCLVTALTAERDELRDENAALRAAQKACEACDEPTAFEVRQFRAELAAAKERLRNEAMDDYASIKNLQRELATEREKVRVLRHALENLCDEQNGAPLCTREEEWKQAMDGADAALAVTKDAK
jgi:predicted RNase H-like nuclease (RuvC/YqgF family)